MSGFFSIGDVDDHGQQIWASPMPSPGLTEAVPELARAAEVADGVAPFDEHTLLSLRTESPDQHHLVLLNDGRFIGYAHLDAARPGEPASAELAVHPQARRQGRGTQFLQVLAEVHQQTRPGREALQIWSHGNQPGARALAARQGFVVVRELLQWRRPLTTEPAPPDLPAGVTLRAFRPGDDDAAWLALNATAFAQHPEQGRMTQADLDARIAEPWFDPSGFLIAERDGRMAGYHWTKIHPAGEGGERLGEVYVLGVDPEQHGGGLGRALTTAGLRYLFEQGISTVLLYVEADNEPALAVYRRLEFTPWRTDVMYRSNEPR